jgi:hypothetical protein
LKEKFQELKKFEQREDFELGTYRELNSDLIELKAAASEQLQMTDSDRRDLFGHLADLISEVKAMETSALANLQEALLSKRWEEYKS